MNGIYTPQLGRHGRMGAIPEKQPHELYIAPLTGIVKCSVTGRWIPLINVLLCREKASYNCGTDSGIFPTGAGLLPRGLRMLSCTSSMLVVSHPESILQGRLCQKQSTQICLSVESHSLSLAMHALLLFYFIHYAYAAQKL